MANREVPLAASDMALLATEAAMTAHVIQEPPPEIPVFIWTSFYLGIEGGHGECRDVDFDDTDIDGPGEVGDFDRDSLTVTVGSA